MENTNNIDFKNLRLSGVKKDESNKMEQSFFSDVYLQAKSIVNSIVKFNNKDEMGKKNLETNEIQNSINNVMAFIGRRGTGKTSAMLSVAGALEDKDPKKNGNKAFYALPYTDVSVFEEKEDAFIITLSKMFAFLSDSIGAGGKYLFSDKGEKYKFIRDKICTIYDHYVSFKGSDEHKLNSSYNLMEKVEDRYNVHREFEKLVKEYIEFLNSNLNSDCDDGYLIICLDDIDMTRHNHINIMQCIHQYFMIPNVIVMVTMRVPILSAALQKEFFASLHTVASADESNLKLSREQQEDYTRKIIPSGMRITMPSWRKRDYQTTNPIKIVFRKDDYEESEVIFEKLKGSKLFENYSSQKNIDKDYLVSPKELIMIMLSDRTNIYLDSQGKKYHFMEPNSLRNLYDLFYLMYNMEQVVADDEEKIASAIKSNRKVILDYLHFKMIPDGQFKDGIESYITELLQEPIERRGEKIWDYYVKCINSSSEREKISSLFGDSFYKEETKKHIIENYGMGEVYRALYFATRLGLAKMDKHLVEFILASFSFTLPQFVKKEISDITRGESYSKSPLCNLFGYTLIGEWRKDLFNGSEVDIVIGCEKMEELFTGNSEESEVDDFLKKFLYLILFSSKAPGETVGVSKRRYNYTHTDSEPMGYHFGIEADPTSFIINSFDTDERFNETIFKFDDEPIVCGVSAIFKTIIDKDFKGKQLKYDIPEKIKTLTEEIKKELAEDQNSLQFLLEQTDLSYSVIKRSVSRMIYVGNSNLKAKSHVANDPVSAIKCFYYYMIKYLKQQDDVYFLGLPDGGFERKFKKHPIVCLVESLSNNSPLSLSYSINYHNETLLNCLDNLRDENGGIFYTDILSFKQYYRDYLDISIDAQTRREISYLIEAYRNGEHDLRETIDKIDKALKNSLRDFPI